MKKTVDFFCSRYAFCNPEYVVREMPVEMMYGLQEGAMENIKAMFESTLSNLGGMFSG